MPGGTPRCLRVEEPQCAGQVPPAFPSSPPDCLAKARAAPTHAHRLVEAGSRLGPMHHSLQELHRHLRALPKDLSALGAHTKSKLRSLRRARGSPPMNKARTAVARLEKRAFQIAIQEGCDVTVGLRKARRENPYLYQAMNSA